MISNHAVSRLLPGVWEAAKQQLSRLCGDYDTRRRHHTFDDHVVAKDATGCKAQLDSSGSRAHVERVTLPLNTSGLHELVSKVLVVGDGGCCCTCNQA